MSHYDESWRGLSVVSSSQKDEVDGGGGGRRGGVTLTSFATFIWMCAGAFKRFAPFDFNRRSARDGLHLRNMTW